MRSPPETREPLRERREDSAPFFLKSFHGSISLLILFVVAVSQELQEPAAAAAGHPADADSLDCEKPTFPASGASERVYSRCPGTSLFQLPLKMEEVMN